MRRDVAPEIPAGSDYITERKEQACREAEATVAKWQKIINDDPSEANMSEYNAEMCAITQRMYEDFVAYTMPTMPVKEALEKLGDDW